MAVKQTEIAQMLRPHTLHAQWVMNQARADVERLPRRQQSHRRRRRAVHQVTLSLSALYQRVPGKRKGYARAPVGRTC